MECRALARLRLGPDAAAVAVDDPLHDRQAHPRALVILGPVQPLEHAEELMGIPHVEPHAVVPDEIGPLGRRIAVVPAADLDPRHLLRDGCT